MGTKKKKNRPQASRSPFAPYRIDFLTELPLDVCIGRLQSRQRTDFWPIIKTTVNVLPLDEDTYTFSLGRNSGECRIGIEGYLKRWDQDTTLVTGEALVYGTYKFLLFIMGVTLFSMLILFSLTWAFVICLPIFLASLVWAIKALSEVNIERKAYARSIQNMLDH